MLYGTTCLLILVEISGSNVIEALMTQNSFRWIFNSSNLLERSLYYWCVVEMLSCTEFPEHMEMHVPKPTLRCLLKFSQLKFEISDIRRHPLTSFVEIHWKEIWMDGICGARVYLFLIVTFACWISYICSTNGFWCNLYGIYFQVGFQVSNMGCKFYQVIQFLTMWCSTLCRHYISLVTSLSWLCKWFHWTNVII